MSACLIFSKNSYSLRYFRISFIFSAIYCLSLRGTPPGAALVAVWELVMMLSTLEGCDTNCFKPALLASYWVFVPFVAPHWPALPRLARGLRNPFSLIPEASFFPSDAFENKASSFGSAPYESRTISGSVLNASMKFSFALLCTCLLGNSWESSCCFKILRSCWSKSKGTCGAVVVTETVSFFQCTFWLTFLFLEGRGAASVFFAPSCGFVSLFPARGVREVSSLPPPDPTKAWCTEVIVILSFLGVYCWFTLPVVSACFFPALEDDLHDLPGEAVAFSFLSSLSPRSEHTVFCIPGKCALYLIVYYGFTRSL